MRSSSKKIADSYFLKVSLIPFKIFLFKPKFSVLKIIFFDLQFQSLLITSITFLFFSILTLSIPLSTKKYTSIYSSSLFWVRLSNKFSSFFKDEILDQKKYIRDLSKGNQKKVGITASLIGSPELIVLDEPFSNLDPSSQILLKKLIEKFSKNQNTTFLISSHDLTHVTEVCNRIVLLEKGVVVKDIETNKATLKELEGYFTE